ncbi:MAG: hypothetical protein HMLKMBBP_03797 [Planctomycetes bacterium]|nr:hypothetical protein [Planctomycetota bacterium]
MTEPAPPDPNGAASARRARRCLTCGREAAEEARFCAGCGSALSGSVQRSLTETLGPWRELRTCIVFYLIYLATVIPVALAGEEHSASATLFVGLLDAGLIAAFWAAGKPSIRDLLRFGPPARRWTAIGIGLLVPALAVNFLYHAGVEGVFGLDEEGYAAPFEREGYGFEVTVFAICVMPGVWEEIAFRGLIQRRLEAFVPSRDALYVTAILFAVIHCSVISGAYLFALGVLLGRLRRESGSLVPGMIVHGLHNLAVLGWEAWRA